MRTAALAPPISLTVSRRFPFAASLRRRPAGLPWQECLRLYGETARAGHSTGANFVATLGFTGAIDEVTGMVVNVAVIKERVLELLARAWDHHFLNLDHPHFASAVPTPENLARRLLAECQPLFDDLAARPVVCHVAETPSSGATAYADGRVERWAALEFCAARHTGSPQLSAAENQRRFGMATGLHGHSYLLRVVLGGEVDATTGVIAPEAEVEAALSALHQELDHRHLNEDVPALQGQPITTEWLARYAFQRLGATLPVVRTRLWELSWLSAEYLGGERAALVVESALRAAHRLHAPALDDDANRALYGKCNNPAGHGHRYLVEAACEGMLDASSGTVAELGEVRQALEAALAPWQMRHLDEETPDFRDRPSTSENIVAILWPRLDERLRGRLFRLRLWETENNRFTLRRNGGAER
jgi:6-pyruvoyltetrahydropterin/6-carboxytetrahydropterin synthase